MENPIRRPFEETDSPPVRHGSVHFSDSPSGKTKFGQRVYVRHSGFKIVFFAVLTAIAVGRANQYRFSALVYCVGSKDRCVSAFPRMLDIVSAQPMLHCTSNVYCIDSHRCTANWSLACECIHVCREIFCCI